MGQVEACDKGKLACGCEIFDTDGCCKSALEDGVCRPKN